MKSHAITRSLGIAALRISLVAWLLAGVLSGATPATTYLAPYRALTDEEILLNSCELAEAIVLVRVLRMDTAFFPKKGITRSVGIMLPVANCEVLDELKGPLARGTRVTVQITPRARDGIDMTRPQMLFLIETALEDNYTSGKTSTLPHWAQLDAPDVLGSERFAVERNGGWAYHSWVRNGIGSLRPSLLATRADAVVEAELLRRPEPCATPEGSRPCYELGGEELVYGSPLGQGVAVVAPSPGYLSRGRMLLYLRQLDSSTYEAIGLSAGAQSIKAGTVGRRGKSLAEVKRELREADRLRKHTGPEAPR